MSFYESISDFYSQIFPLNPGQLRFIKDVIADPAHCSLLDVGCGTGELTLGLTSTFKRVVGIDLDGAMLDQAKSSTGKINNVEFVQMDMLDIGDGFESGAFNSIVCFGNTLVHLQSPVQIAGFIEQCGQVISAGGSLLMQIIHYDRILDQGIKSLPTIDTSEITFARNYHFQEEKQLIDFETILTVKKTNRIIRNHILLYPLRTSEIRHFLELGGFQNVKFFGGFNRAPLEPDSQALVVEAWRAS